MTTAVIYTGGILHPFESAAPALGRLLERVGLSARISFELDEALDWLKTDPAALLVVYALRWTMTQNEKYAPDRPRWSLQLAPAARQAITRHVEAGGGLLGIHTASICFDDWPEWRDVLGGAWCWGKSWHPPLGRVHVRLSQQHFITRGLTDFSLSDEAYSDLELAPGLEVAGYVQDESGSTGAQPALWLHRYGKGRAVYDSLGHDAASLEHPVHSRLLQRAALWACGRPEHIVEAI